MLITLSVFYPHRRNILLLIALGFLIGCNSAKKDVSVTQTPLFSLMAPDSTGVGFVNQLTEGLNTNVLMYEYFYNGGGVAIGDINGDGLDDIYFSANMSSNKIYLNSGGMKFQDITDQSGAAGRAGPWKTGVNMVDINGDGRQDIYLCYSGEVQGPRRINQLFINDGNDAGGMPRFSDRAAEYGLADSAYSTQAVFLDYDRDGDLDMFLLNHNPQSLPVLDEVRTRSVLAINSPMQGVKLYRNDNMKFRDVTRDAKISSSALTYCLGAGIADFNNDGWPDIYVSNDYAIPDYIYINNHDGTFTDRIQQMMGHFTHFSMGNDVADINNDGLPDVITLDMLPETNHRQKLLFAPDNYEKFDLNLKSGFYYQYMRNMLQLNNGDGSFSEIGQLSGISNTDWSWAPLLADFDNDGWKDLFVSNGFLRDFTNMDFMKYMGDYLQNNSGNIRRQNILDLVSRIPSSEMKSYFFRNNKNLGFIKTETEWGISGSSNSNGAAYADLDNDGDLDLVVNNINQPAFIYRNESKDHHYLRVRLKGEGQNTEGIGASVWLYNRGGIQRVDQMPGRGFQSSVSPVLHFGLGELATVDSIRIRWQSGKTTLLKSADVDRELVVEESAATVSGSISPEARALFAEVAFPVPGNFTQERLNDFKRQPLLVNPLSATGPCLVKVDLDGNGLEDLFEGASDGLPAAIYLQDKNGKFSKSKQPELDKDIGSQDADAVMFDANKDGAMDLYVCKGGYHQFDAKDPLLQDRFYLNDGKGRLVLQPSALPSMLVSKSCVRVADLDGDGDQDLFVGGRVIPGRYPETPESYLLINDGKGHFTDQTEKICPELKTIGMVTDAAWTDMNNDRIPDLIVVGEWMPVSVWINNKTGLVNKSGDYFDRKYQGWWNKLLCTDLNADGRPDLVVGNLGLNSQCRVSDKKPAELFYKDFDNNGSVDPIFCFYVGDTSYPYVSRDELLDQLTIMRTRFPDYHSYADARLENIFTPSELKDAGRLIADFLESACFLSNGNGKYTQASLPLQAQFSPVFTINAGDFNKDGRTDLLFCGNINNARLRFGKYDANYGMVMLGDGKGGFTYLSQRESGLHLKGDVRSVLQFGDKLVFGVAGSRPAVYK